ncbi:MAG: SAM-dependent methyltransferase [Thermoplasmatota archaeon]
MAGAPGVVAALRQRAARGPIPFREWMRTCLYSDDGYYMRAGRKTGPGRDADFATAPSLHPFFGVAVAREFAAWAHRVGGEPVVVEFGGGEGGLARGALTELDRAWPGANELRWIHVEKSPVHRAAQGGDARLEWASGMPKAASAFVVCNEFLDALPFSWWQRTERGWQEIAVAWKDGWTEALCDDVSPGPAAPLGTRRVIHDEFAPWFASVSEAAETACILAIDYGAKARAELVRTFSRHQPGADPLADPGMRDITADVDFAAATTQAERCRMREVAFESQEEFLLRHGILEELNRIPRSTVEGASSYLRLRQLLLPTGLGSFRVARWEKP